MFAALNFRWLKIKLALKLWTPSMVSYRLKGFLFRWVMDRDGDIGVEVFHILTLIKYKESTIFKWNAKYPDAPKRITQIIPDAVRSYMSRPCSITSDNKLWYIGGTNKLTGGGGVLAWCFDERDANEALSEFLSCGLFSSLCAKKWEP